MASKTDDDIPGKANLFLGERAGTSVCHLLQDLKVPASKLKKDFKFIKLEIFEI